MSRPPAGCISGAFLFFSFEKEDDLLSCRTELSIPPTRVWNWAVEIISSEEEPILRGKVCLKMSSSKPKWRQLYFFFFYRLETTWGLCFFLFLPRELRWPSRHPVLNQPPFIASRSQTILLWDLNFASTCLTEGWTWAALAVIPPPDTLEKPAFLTRLLW